MKYYEEIVYKNIIHVQRMLNNAERQGNTALAASCRRAMDILQCNLYTHRLSQTND